MENRSYIEWGTIFAGAFVACAITAVLVQFGAAVGLTQTSPYLSADANITPGFVLGTGIWMLWVQVIASLTGGYLAGRMRTPIADANATAHESDMRDGVHGLLVWATATLMVVLAVGVVTSVAALVDNPVEDAKRIADIPAAQKNATVIFAFFAAATSLVSAVISWAAATVGGNHRDTRVDHSRYFSFRVIR
jgi:hypothetical protein